MNKTLFRSLLVVYMGAILSLSFLPATRLPSSLHLIWDKGLHFIEYSILGILALKSVDSRSLRTLLLIVGLGLAFALLDEFVQSWAPGRYTSSYDILADGLGLAVGIFLARAVEKP